MDDRGTSGNHRSKQSFSHEEDDYFAVSDRRNSRSKAQNQSQPKALEKVRSAFTSRSYVNHGERAERTNRGRSSRADHSEHMERISQRNATKRWDADNRGERNFRVDRANRSESAGRSDRANRSDNADRTRSVGRSDSAGRPQSANRLNNDGRMSRADRTHRADIRRRETYRDSNAESLRQGNSRNRIAGSSQRSRSARDASMDASQRRRSSASLRSSYGRASDYARHADNDPRQDFELGDGYQSRRRRGEFSDPDGGQIDRMGYSERGERDRRGERYPRGERHSRDYDFLRRRLCFSRFEKRPSFRTGSVREIRIWTRNFGGRPSLPFGLGGYGTGYRGGHAAGGGSLFSALPLPVLYALPVVVLILIIVLLVFVVSSVQSCSSGGEQEQIEVQEVQPVNLSYQASVTGLDSVADSGSSIAGFTLANEGQNYMPSLSEEGQNTIQTALAPFMENEYDVGFILMDLQTGSGYSYNLDQEVYGASSFKGPVLIYGCQEALEPGILSIDTVNDSASNAIIYSDNNSYYNMRAIFEEYSEISLVNWLANMNIDSDVETDTSFPHYSVRESAKLWMNAYLYFTSSESDPEIVSWAQDLFSQTEVSMLRAGVDPSFALITDGGEVYINQATQTDQSGDQANSEENTDQSGDQSNDDQSSDQQSGDQQSSDQSSDQSANQQEDTSSGLSAADMATSGSNIVVYDKAGWLNGETDDGLCDAGIVYDGDKAYLISVMTGAPDGDGTREDLARLVAALWIQRSTLAPSEGYVLLEPMASSSTDQSQNTENQG